MEVLGVIITGIIFSIVSYVVIWQFSRYSARKNLNVLLRQSETVSVELQLYNCILHSFSRELVRDEDLNKRIAIIAPYGLTRKLTVQTRLLPIALGLTAKGYEVRVFVPDWDLPLKRLPSHIGNLSITQIQAPWNPFGYLNLILGIKLITNINQYKPDIIYSFKPVGYSGAASLLFSKLKSNKFMSNYVTCQKVVVDSDDWEGQNGWADRTSGRIGIVFRDFQQRLVLQNADAITIASESLRDKIHKLVATVSSQPSLHHISDGVVLNAWKVGRTNHIEPSLQAKIREYDNPHIVLSFTRFGEFSASRLVEVYGALLNEIPNTLLIIVGNSFDEFSRNQKFKFMSLAKEMGFYDKLLVTGWVRHEQLKSYLQVAEVAIQLYDRNLINNSKSSTKILELMAMKKPIVADKVGGVMDFIDHERDGYLVEEEQVDKFVQHIVQLLRDESLRQRIGRNAFEKVKRYYQWENQIPKIMDVMESLDGANPNHGNLIRETARNL